MRSKRKRRHPCIYCMASKASTSDHVIPRCLFVPPYPPNMVTVPVCLACNQAKAEDDAYLRDFLVADFAASQSPAADALLRGKVRRSIARNSSEVGRAIIRNSQEEPLYTKAGIYIGQVVTAPLNDADARFSQVFARIIRGLFYHHTKSHIPAEYPVTVRRIMPWNVDQLWRSFGQLHLSRCHPMGDVFDGACARVAEDPMSTAWMFSFYGRAHFAVTAFSPALAGRSVSKALTHTR